MNEFRDKSKELGIEISGVLSRASSKLTREAVDAGRVDQRTAVAAEMVARTIMATAAVANETYPHLLQVTIRTLTAVCDAYREQTDELKELSTEELEKRANESMRKFMQ